MRRHVGVTGAVMAILAGLVAPVGPAGSDTAEAVAGVSSPYPARYLVEPNPLNSTGGMALDGRGGLFICQALSNRLVRLDLASGTLTPIADETDAAPLLVPDDVALGPDGNLYVTNILGRDVTRVSPDGKQRKVVASNIGDGGSGANGIAFNAEGRLFATDLSFSDPKHPGGLWEIDPAGVKPAIPILRNLPAPEGFAFGPDGLAYVPMMFPGRIDVIDVDTRSSRTLVEGFGYLVSLKVDGEGRLVVMETDTGKVYRVDRQTGQHTLLAQGEPGLDNLLVAPDGTIYVSNFARGNVRRVNEAAGTLDPVLPERPLTLPFSISEAPDGSLVVGDFTAVSRVVGGQSTRLSRLLISDLQLLTPGAAQVGDSIYFSDFLPPDGRIFRLDVKTGKRERVASGFGMPWTVRAGPAGHLLVGDQAAGAVVDLDLASGAAVPVIGGLRSPSGLAYDAGANVLYVSDYGAGRVLGVDLATHRPSVVASGLAGPEGVAVDHDGSLLVVEADAGRLARLDRAGGSASVVATGLPTRRNGIGLPLLNYTADVLVRADGSIVVSGPADGSLIELRRPPSG